MPPSVDTSINALYDRSVPVTKHSDVEGQAPDETENTDWGNVSSDTFFQLSLVTAIVPAVAPLPVSLAMQNAVVAHATAS
jgi:hypothetical protein